MAHITLPSILRAAWSLHLAGALPNPPGVSVERIVGEQGMRPWLHLALSPEDVAALYADGKAAWHMGALLGIDPLHKGQVLSCPSGQASLIRFVEGLCSEADTTVMSLLFAERQRVESYGDEMVRSFLAPFEIVSGGEKAYPVIVDTLRALAEAFDVDLSSVAPADLSIWSETVVEATISEHHHQPKAHAFMEVDAVTDDGRKVKVRYVHHEDAFVGKRIHVNMKAVTPFHGGYAVGYRKEEDVRLMEDVNRRLALVFEAAASPSDLVCKASDGTVLEANDYVMLNCDCLEAGKGTYGYVVEIVGDMADVQFDGVDEVVPCYGYALDAVGSVKEAA